jgi:hypothetical protein
MGKNSKQDSAKRNPFFFVPELLFLLSFIFSALTSFFNFSSLPTTIQNQVVFGESGTILSVIPESSSDKSEQTNSFISSAETIVDRYSDFGSISGYSSLNFTFDGNISTSSNALFYTQTSSSVSDNFCYLSAGSFVDSINGCLTVYPSETFIKNTFGNSVDLNEFLDKTIVITSPLTNESVTCIIGGICGHINDIDVSAAYSYVFGDQSFILCQKSLSGRFSLTGSVLYLKAEKDSVLLNYILTSDSCPMFQADINVYTIDGNGDCKIASSACTRLANIEAFYFSDIRQSLFWVFSAISLLLFVAWIVTFLWLLPMFTALRLALNVAFSFVVIVLVLLLKISTSFAVFAAPVTLGAYSGLFIFSLSFVSFLFFRSKGFLFISRRSKHIDTMYIKI